MAKMKGIEALQAKLKRIPKQARSEIRQALAEGSDAMVATMRSLAPASPSGTRGFPSGHLKASIVATFGDGSVPKYAAFRSRKGRRVIRANDPDLSVTISAGDSDVRYAHLVEFGTRPHLNKGKFAGTMHPGTRAQPFFYPGYRAHKKAMRSRITRAITRSAKKAVARG